MTTVDLVPTFGALFVGTFLQGVLFLQTYNYFENFPKDRLGLKIFVAVLWLLDLAHLILAGQTTYHYLVISWGDVSALAHATVGLDIHLSFIGLVALMCQSFYLYRIYLIGDKNFKNYLLLGVLAVGCLTMFALALTLSILFLPESLISSFSNPHRARLGISIFSLGAALDTLIAGLMCYYLQKGKTGFRSTNTIIARIMQYTLATSLLTTALAVATLIAKIMQKNTNSLVFIAMHFSLGRMYTNSIVYSLNSRQKFLHSGDVMTFAVQEGTLGSNDSVPFPDESKRRTNKVLKVSAWKESLPIAQVV